MKKMASIIFVLIIFSSNSYADKKNLDRYDHVFKKYGKKYNIPYFLLKAIAMSESSLNHKAKRVNSNNTTDIGLMQINTLWLKQPSMKKINLTRNRLWRIDTNVEAACIILSQLIKKRGYSWETVGRYHSGTPKLKRKWISRVKRKIIYLSKKEKNKVIISKKKDIVVARK